MDVDEETLAIIQRHIRQIAISSDGKAGFREVMLSIGKELDRDAVRSLIPTIKQEIEAINSKSIEELKQDSEEDEEGVIENEYDELSTMFTKALEGKSYVRSLIAYGSYGKGNHIMGQSNLNFLLILKDMDQAEQEQVGDEIKEIIQNIMNPLYEYLFDLVILFENNVSSLEAFQERMGPGFTAIHGFSAGQCTPLLGDNPFTGLDLGSKINESGKMILIDTIHQFKEGKKAIEAEGDPSTEDLAYISSEAIIDYSLALIYYHMDSASLNHVTKPDIRDTFPEMFQKDKKFKLFVATVENSFAYRMGVSKIADSEITEESIIEQCEKMTSELEKLVTN